MTNFLVKKFIKDSDNINDSAVRGKYGILSGIVGIAVNVILCLSKFFVGTITGSIAITADAVNNLSDAGSSAVTVFGFKMASRPADDEHPFGHGRIEYITAMIVSFIILFMGGELAIQSVGKIKNPEDVTFNIVGAIIIGVSILGKVWLALFNRKLGKKINSPAMMAVVADSISDIAATSTTLIALVLSAFFPKLHIDGWLGIVVACFVLKSGLEIFKETLGALIGEPPTKEKVKELEDMICSYPYVSGIHDLMMHNYGPGNYFASIHVEMPASIDTMIGHDIIDNIEHDVEKKMGIQLTIHFDPVENDNENVMSLKELTDKIIKDIDPNLTLHDFRVVEGNTHTNLIFDVVVPRKFNMTKEQLNKKISDSIHEKDSKLFAIIKIEHNFV